MKKILRELTPPIIWDTASKLKNKIKPTTKQIATKEEKPEWEYIPEGWEAQKKDPNIKGWDVKSVLEAYQANWSTFVQNLEGTLPWGISPESNSSEHNNLMFHNIIMTYGYALTFATRNKSSISMLDWGGGIGHYYLISKKLCPDLQINYYCKDVPTLAEYGQTLFPDAHFYTDDNCLNQKYDFILASTSLHYSEDWQSTLKGLAKATKGYLFINRFPILHHSASFVMIQRAYQYGYNTEYLGWAINKQEFLSFANNLGLKLVREFIGQYSFPVENAPESPQYWGFLLTSLSNNNN